ncbi:hypothetical protein [Flavonifractor sp. An306]|uniref:hypothetical protein n=1 Tax=Flavonifractor sp. An306 TaxID=1965629 RepID=UPI0017498F02|nr:hypothetical protein [Flavonifractor sp. An306]
MTYEAKVLVPGKLMSVINGYLCAETQDEFQDVDSTITITIHFPNGYEMDIKCCGARDESSWTEAVLFAPTGDERNGLSQVAYTEPDESFEGEWILDSDDDTYSLLVENGGNIEHTILAPVNDSNEHMAPGWGVC